MCEKDLNSLVASRGYCKGVITRIYNKIAEFNNETQFILKSKFDRVNLTFKEYENITKVILSLDNNDTEDVSLMEDKYFTIINELQKCLLDKETKALKEPISTINNAKIKLPAIHIPVFLGKYTDYTPFINLFMSVVSKDSSLDGVQKLFYLQSFLKGEPLDIVKNLPLISSSYDEALRLLDERYNNKYRIVYDHINAMLDLAPIVKSSQQYLRDFVSQIKQILAALKNLGTKVEDWDDIILCILTRKLDMFTARAYQLDRNTATEPSVKEFLQYLDHRALALENAEPAITTKPRVTLNAAAEVASRNKTFIKCLYCKSNNHKIFNCEGFKLLNVNNRLIFINENMLCKICLNKHTGKCRYHFRCGQCKKDHNTLIHTEQLCPKINLMAQSNTNKVLLPTAKVKLIGAENSEIHVKAILDSASQVSLVTRRVVELLRLAPNKNSINIIGVANTKNNTKYSVSLDVHSLTSPFQTSINCQVVDKITCKLPQTIIDTCKFKIPSNIILADEQYNWPSEIELLIGADVFFQVLIPPQHVQNSDADTPSIVNTKFGNIIAGSVPDECPSKKVTSLLCIKCNTDISELMSRFWKTEKVPESFTEECSEYELCENIFNNSVKLNNNRFTVDLPMKLPLEDINKTLGNSFDLAYYRFLNLEKRLHKNIDLLVEYKKFIHEYETLGHGEFIDFNSYDLNVDPVYFLPHHAVINENSTSTKTRVVFDASMKTRKRICLNDLLLAAGPVQKELFDIMLLFRFGDHTFTTDIQKMFRNIKVNSKYTSLQNILWRDDPSKEIKCLRLNTVTYGLKNSGFLATRCLIELANRYGHKYPLASFILRNCCYVDDIIYSHSDLQTVLEAKQQLRDLLRLGGFKTHKWASNVPEALNDIPISERQFKEIDFQRNDYKFKTLGLVMDVKNDCFIIKCPTSLNKDSVTKKSVLSYIARFYDPMGFVSPIIVRAKLIMQRLWSAKIRWDETVPADIQEQWLEFTNGLAAMDLITLNRNISVPDPAIVQLIGFADASSSVGYGACIYLRVVDKAGNVTINLLCSKSRINPRDKPLTVPRLELNAGLLLSDLMTKTHNILCSNIKIDKVLMYSDSKVVLAWLKTEVTRLQAYVANRVQRINQVSYERSWLYVNTQENPADLISRGIDARELPSCRLWWNGPTFLHDGRYSYKCDTSCDLPNELPELKYNPESKQTVLLVTQHRADIFQAFEKYSDLNKKVRIMAYVLRFIRNVKTTNDRVQEYFLHSNELQQSLNILIKGEQSFYFKEEIDVLGYNLNIKGVLKPLHPFIDESGLLRVGGRLHNTDFSYTHKHPIILPKNSKLTELIIRTEHLRLLHANTRLLLASLNQKYWIVNGSRIVKKCIYKCLICFKLKATASQQLMGSLPQQRVTAARPFEKVGIDFAGPVEIKNSRIRKAVVTKGYVCVLVCFVTKAIHLELVSDMTTESFLACFKRFIARRGLPSEVFCDNASNFRGASNKLVALYKLHTSASHQSEVQNYTSQQGIRFHFIPSYSPVFAGLAEAAVKSMKFHLKRIVLSSILTYEQFNTVLVQIEAVLNSRPILPTSQDVSDYSYLTPGHFLIGTAMTSYPECDVSGVPINRLKFWQICNSNVQKFWKVWHKYYLNSLQCRAKWRDDIPNIRMGMLVILKESNVSPLFWPMARVVKVYPGKDDKVRAVDVKIPNGKIYTRSLSTICILPINEE